jgi:protein involved in polysaccharide export with SLBB domain
MILKPKIFPAVFFVLVAGGVFAAGCTTKATARLRAENAYLAGQNVALRQQAAAPNPNGVTVTGAVQNQQVPWVAGLTLQQAIATANYIGQDEPRQVIITRRGESAVMDAKVVFSGAEIPLETGDVIELR